MSEHKHSNSLSAFPKGSCLLAKITPYEISHGVLIPGHRFEPLRPLDALPWKLALKSGESKIAVKKIPMSFRESGMYFSFFDNSAVPFMLAEDDESNLTMLMMGQAPDIVRLSAFDMKAFYEANGLAAGDYVELRQEDEKGLSYSARPRPAASISPEARTAWLAALAEGFRTAMEKMRAPHDNLALIRGAFEAAPPSVRTDPVGALSDLVNEGEVIDFTQYAGARYLWAKGANIPELFAETGIEAAEDASELEKCLAELEISLSEDEIGSFVRDELGRGGSVDSALDRCFTGLDRVGYKKAELLAVRKLAHEFGKKIEARIANEGREQPAVKELRSAVLALYEQFLLWMRSVGEGSTDPKEILESRAFQELAEIMKGVALMTALFNHPDQFDAPTLRQIKAAIPAMAQDAKLLFPALKGQSVGAGSGSGGTAKKGRKKAARPKAAKIFIFTMRFADIEPPIMSLVEVPGNRSLAELHAIILAAFGWSDSHLHEFVIRKEHYATPSPEDFQPVIDERTVRLEELSLRGRSKIAYHYDFGDDWMIELEVKTSIPFTEGCQDIAVCLEGKRAAPPEDSGGPWAYADLAAALAKPKGKRNSEGKELVGLAGDYDPEAFDLEATNKRLAKCK